VSVVDTATDTVVATIASGGASTPADVAITPDGAHAYVPNFNSNNVSVIDTATNTISSLIPGFSGPGSVSITPDGTHAYVANENSNTVSVIDTATNTVTATIPVGSTPTDVLVDPAGGTAYVANGGGNSVSVINTATDTVTATITGVGAVPFDIAMAAAPPVVTGVSPAHGAEPGGNQVTITGQHLAGASSVLFGSAPATNVKVINALTVTATAPAHTDGTVDVTVTTPAGTSATGGGDHYTYDEPAPAVTGVIPPSGPVTGGHRVTITGTDFAGATGVSFG